MGLPDLIAELAGERKVEFSIERALFAMVANRACAPSSKLYCHEQWLAEDVRIEGCEGLEVHHLYRAMDFLEAHKEELERGLYFRVADLLNLDVELVFYDTTSLHFEIDDEDRVEGGDGESGDPPPAGGTAARGLRRQGNSKSGRGDAPQVIVGLAVTREGFPVRQWVFYHHATHRIHAHVALTVIALLLERMAEHACGATWRRIRDDLKRVQLVQLIGPHRALRQVTEPRPEASKWLKSLGIEPPATILKLD